MTASEREILVHCSVTVPLPRERSFELFTSRMKAFWPPQYSINTAPTKDIRIEPEVGGRWYELGTDGSECDWGRVAAWDPPGRAVLLWQITAEWKHDPDFETELELTFTDTEPGTSRVDLRHRHLERYGDQAEHIRSIFDAPDGWNGILARFADIAT